MAASDKATQVAFSVALGSSLKNHRAIKNVVIEAITLQVRVLAICLLLESCILNNHS